MFAPVFKWTIQPGTENRCLFSGSLLVAELFFVRKSGTTFSMYRLEQVAFPDALRVAGDEDAVWQDAPFYFFADDIDHAAKIIESLYHKVWKGMELTVNDQCFGGSFKVKESRQIPEPTPEDKASGICFCRKGKVGNAIYDYEYEIKALNQASPEGVFDQNIVDMLVTTDNGRTVLADFNFGDWNVLIPNGPCDLLMLAIQQLVDHYSAESH